MHEFWDFGSLFVPQLRYLHYNANASSNPVRRDGSFWYFGSLCQAVRCGNLQPSVAAAAGMDQLTSVEWRPASLFSTTGNLNTSMMDHTKEMKNNAIFGAVFRFSIMMVWWTSPFYFRKYREPRRLQIQHIYRIVDVTVCYNTKTAIQTVWSSDSVVIKWWTSLYDAKTSACIQWLGRSHEVSGFSGLCRSPGSASDKNPR